MRTKDPVAGSTFGWVCRRSASSTARGPAAHAGARKQRAKARPVDRTENNSTRFGFTPRVATRGFAGLEACDRAEFEYGDSSGGWR
jgi:hypothetical protein